MTRDSEIKEAAAKRHYFHSDTREGKIAMTSFMEGARWADEHPKQIEIPLEDIEESAKEAISDYWVERQDRLWKMIERNLKAQFIEKACDWLDENMNDVGIRFMRGDEIKDIVDLFRKAMKGE